MRQGKMSQSDSDMRIEQPTELDVYKKAFARRLVLFLFLFSSCRAVFLSGSLAPCLPIYLSPCLALQA